MGVNDVADPNAQSSCGKTQGPVGTNCDSAAVDTHTKHSPKYNFVCARVSEKTSPAGPWNADEILRKAVPGILEKVSSDLDFSLGGVRISHSGLRRIAELIRCGAISVAYANPEEYFVPGNVVARYRPEKDQLIFHAWPPQGLANEATIIHESVHALIDYQRQNVPWRVQEMSAYVAEGWYVWRNGSSYPGMTPRAKLAVNTAKVIYAAIHHSTALKKYKEKYPDNWKQRIEDALKRSYDKLVKSYKGEYEELGKMLKKPMTFSDVVDVDGIAIQDACEA